MALLADYQARFATQLRTNVSNPQQTTNTTPDTTLEGLAASDVGGRFQAICGVVYDSTIPMMVDACCQAVYVKLQVWTGQVDPAAYEAITAYFETIKLVLGRDRLTPLTNSTLSQTPEPQGAAVAADWTKFRKYVPDQFGPGGRTADESGTNP
jgi:hypothetical protein